ncbi:uncharacterized protein LOC113227990 [Hyposmocoma kahamanoa]|uniref:uncharacterized protein LOC113227990 n=1 Tax=Hyposmocoma kahamanoa TaxID=1477025 RepID=UPI000E6D7C92|nr:uncharacterized protein LOC113227990 [Hyposmocoma kahamanoa]
MGCTSSAPNNPPSHTDSEKDLSMTEDIHEETEKQPNEVIRHKETEINGIKVLPTCDTLDEPTQLDRNNKTFVDMSSPEPEQDIGPNQHFLKSDEDSVHNSPGMKISQSEEKLSTMEEVVEKVVELYVENTWEKSQDEFTKTEDKTVTTEKENKVIPVAAQPPDVEENETDESKEILGEVISPVQSPSSRATRWEALADIAAELPPSLTVDPLTGQIYAVSK